MTGPATIDDGGLAVQDPSDEAVYRFDWDDHFVEDASVITSTFTVIAKKPSTATVPTIDSTAIAVDGRSTRLRVKGGQSLAIFEVANKVVTDETPPQTKERSFYVLIQNK